MKELSSYVTWCFSLKSIDASPEESQEQHFVNGYRPLYRTYREQHGWGDICTALIEPQNKREMHDFISTYMLHCSSFYSTSFMLDNSRRKFFKKISILCDLLGFSRSVVKVFILLECGAASLGDWRKQTSGLIYKNRGAKFIRFGHLDL